MSRLLLILNLFAATAIGASNGSAVLAAISPYRAGAARESSPANTATTMASNCGTGHTGTADSTGSATRAACTERHASR